MAKREAEDAQKKAEAEEVSALQWLTVSVENAQGEGRQRQETPRKRSAA